MFKNKGFLYGLGIGLILGACLLQLMNFAVMDDKTLTNPTQTAAPSISPTLEPVISVKPIATVKPISTVKPIATVKPTETTNNPAKAIATVKPTETTNNPAKPIKSAISTPAITKTEEPVMATPVIQITDSAAKMVVIEKGMSSAEVASLLFNQGIITDQKAFDDSLGDLKLDRIIRIGSYTFGSNESDDDIINKITTHK